MLERGSVDGKEPLSPGVSAFGPHPFDMKILYSISPDSANKFFPAEGSVSSAPDAAFGVAPLRSIERF